MKTNFYTMRKGIEYERKGKRYIVVNYTFNYVFLVRLSNCCCPFKIIHVVSYDKLSNKYERVE